ncbi:unnamed protein product, partial [Cladocopium goreaui]
VHILRSICCAPLDPVALHADAWGLKKLFTYGVRKGGHDKDTAVNPFFDELWKHWYVQSGCTDIPVEVDDSDDESSDFTMYLCVKSDPYGPAPDGNGGAVKAGKSELAPPVVAPVEEPTIPVEKLVIVEDSPLKLTTKKEEVDAMPMSTAQIEGRITKL